MKTATTQTSLPTNATDSSRLIAMLRKPLERHGVTKQQAEADDDSLMATTGQTRCYYWY